MSPEPRWIAPEFEIIRGPIHIAPAPSELEEVPASKVRVETGEMRTPKVRPELPPRRELLLSLEREFCSAIQLIAGFVAETLVTVALLKLFAVIRLVADNGPHVFVHAQMLEFAHDAVLGLWVLAIVCRAIRLFVPNLWRAANAPVARLANIATTWMGRSQ